MANLLFGDVSPGGKLPVHAGRGPSGRCRWSTRTPDSHEPENQAATLLGRGQHAVVPVRARPELRPFTYSDLAVDRRPITAGGSRHRVVDVTNTGDRQADEVVQLYIHQRHGSASRPVRELKGFERITLAAGESRTVQFTLGPNERRYWNAASRDWVIEASTFDVWVGGDSTARAGDDVRGQEGVGETKRISGPAIRPRQ